MPFTPMMLHILGGLMFIFFILFLVMPPVTRTVHNPGDSSETSENTSGPSKE